MIKEKKMKVMIKGELDLSKIKYEEVIDLFDRPLNSKNVNPVLKSEYLDLFISEYNFFGQDGNDIFYKKYILDNIVYNYKSQINFSNALILAQKNNFFIEEKLRILVAILNSRKSYFVKLSCFDYFNYFFSEIEKQLYLETSIGVESRTSNEMVLFQARINLLLSDYSFYSSQILRKLIKCDIPSFFYRLNSNFLNYKHFEFAENKHFFNTVSKIISESNFRIEVQNSLLEDIVYILEE